MKQLILGLLVLSGLSGIALADEDTDVSDHRDRRYGVRCVARDHRGGTYEGWDYDYQDARREALRKCHQSRRYSRDDDHDRGRWDRDRWDHDRRGRCYIVHCSRR